MPSQSVSIRSEGQGNTVNLHAVTDEQSNQSLARSDFFDIFSVKGGTEVYTLKTCSGITDVRGRKAKDFCRDYCRVYRWSQKVAAAPDAGM